MIACTAGLSACASHGLWQLAWQLLQRLEAPDPVTCSCYIQALSKALQPARAFDFLAQMPKLTVAANEICYSAAAAACKAATQWPRAVALLGRMRAQELTPSEIVYQVAIVSSHRAQQLAKPILLLHDLSVGTLRSLGKAKSVAAQHVTGDFRALPIRNRSKSAWNGPARPCRCRRQAVWTVGMRLLRLHRGLRCPAAANAAPRTSTGWPFESVSGTETGGDLGRQGHE